MSNQCLTSAFFNWLAAHRGEKVRIEQFRDACPMQVADWQRANTALVTAARAAGLIRACGVTRDRYRSYKTLWRVKR